MKRKIFILALTLILAAFDVYAETTQNIYLQDFSVTTDVSQDITPEVNNSFSAEVKDSALDMKTDSICFFRAGSVFTRDNCNSAENSKGIKYYNRWWNTYSKLDEPRQLSNTDGTTYTVNYGNPDGGTNSFILEEVEGLAAFGFHTFDMNRADRPVATPDVKFVVDSKAFAATDNDVTFRFKVYAEQANSRLNMTYVPKEGGERGKQLFTIAENEVGRWLTKEVDFSDINLTGFVFQDKGQGWEQQYTFRLSTDLGYDIYLHSIEIVKTDEEVNSAAESNKYEVKVNENPLYGDVDFCYDLTFPMGETFISDVCGDACVAESAYNTGKNQLTVNLFNQNMIEIAEVQYNLDGDTGTVSLAYTDESGNTALEQIYQGELIGKEYSYKLKYNAENSTNTFSVFEGENLVAQTSAPLNIKNISEALKTFVQYYSIEHNKSSNAIHSRVDNISISFTENDLYRGISEDLAAIVIPQNVRGNFELPSVGTLYGNNISWASSNTSAITIDGSIARVNRGLEEDIPVTLTATVSNELFSLSGEFEVSVKAFKGEFADKYDVIETDNGETITAVTNLTNAGMSGADKISFIAVSYENGEIIDRDECEMEVLSQYQSIEFDVTVQKGDEIKYYLWDENNVPIVNHAPHIYSATFYNKARGAVVEWEKAYDDFDAVETYQVKRSDGKVFLTDGEENGENILRFFDSDAKDDIVYTYEITALDSNQKTSEALTGRAKKVSMPYSMDLTQVFPSETNYDGGNHIIFIYKSDPARAAHTEQRVYEGQRCIFIPNGKYAAFTTDLARDYKNIAVRFTYASPVNTSFKFMYNGKRDDGTYNETSDAVKEYQATDGWQTVDFRLDKEFRYEGTFSGGHFGLGSASPNGVYIKKVEFVDLEDYE